MGGHQSIRKGRRVKRARDVAELIERLPSVQKAVHKLAEAHTRNPSMVGAGESEGQGVFDYIVNTRSAGTTRD